MSKDSTSYVFMTCRPGAEGPLKLEVAQSNPSCRLAFSRPGFLTFKYVSDRPLHASRLSEHSRTFAHATGISVGTIEGDTLELMAKQVWQLKAIQELVQSVRLGDIHVWQPALAGEQSNAIQPLVSPLCQEIHRELLHTAPDECERLRRSAHARRPSAQGVHTLDVIVLQPNQWWIGYHVAVRRTARWPGGQVPVKMPLHAVSRAYAKMQEALAWSEIPISAGDECIELGCAPGGASQSLLERGLFVTGIDPAEADPQVIAHPRFRHLRMRVKDVRRKEFLGVRWLASDMNIAPQAALEEVERIVAYSGVAIRGMILTLKFPDWKYSTCLPDLAKQVRSWGYREIRMRQLVTGGQEVCLVALRRKALRRLRPTRRPPRLSKRELRFDSGQNRISDPHF